VEKENLFQLIGKKYAHYKTTAFAPEGELKQSYRKFIFCAGGY
jgi:hypothetical protein